MSYQNKTRGKILPLFGIKPHEIGYNPAVIPQKNRHKIAQGQPIIAVRVEDVDSHWLNPQNYNPHIMFFMRVKDRLISIPDTPIFYQYEDPFATWITKDGALPQLLFGAVKVDYSLKIPIVSTYFFLAPSISELNEFAPVAIVRGMKDIRVTQIVSGKLAVFTRPNEGLAFPGRIGFTLINKIEELEQAAANSPLLNFEVDKDTKMGTNEACPQVITTSTGEVRETLRVFCHLATTDPAQKLHYTAYEFNLDPKHPFTSILPLRKIATRLDFPKNPELSKGKIFKDVIFPGGTGGVQLSEFYVGVEDACIGVIDLPTPTKSV